MNSLYDLDEGEYNVAVGYWAGGDITDGDNNVFVGNEAGRLVTTGSNNVVIGEYDGTTTMADEVHIYAGTTERLKIDSSEGTVNGAVINTAGEQTIWIPAAAIYPTTTSGCAALAQVEVTSGRPELKVLDFDPSSDENAQFSISMPKAWNRMTSYSNAAATKFQTFYTVNGTNTGTVKFVLSAVACSHDDTVDVAFGSNYGPVAKAHTGTANDINSSNIQGFEIAGTPAEGDVCFFNIKRDVSGDTQSADVRLIGVKLFFTTDKANDT
jgi:hypothetical protein